MPNDENSSTDGALGRGEETTSWNFERPSVSNNNQFAFPPLPKSENEKKSTITKPPKITRDEAIYFAATPVSTNSFYDSRKDLDSSSVTYSYHPEEFNRVDNRARSNPHRLSFPTINPPSATEAEMRIHDHMRNLLTPDIPVNHHNYGFLPNTSYAPSGEIFDAHWQREHYLRNESAASSLSNSVISLVNRMSMRSKSVNNSMRKPNSALKPLYPLNGIFHQSTKSLQGRSNSYPQKITPLFTISDVIADGEAEKPFLGREWVFKDLHQMIVNEKTQFTLVYGKPGSGKTAIIRQIILQSPFFRMVTNGDTVDSGITIGSESSLSSTLKSRNYEWFKSIASRVIAYHNSRIYSASTCMLPEFTRNIATHLYISPLLNFYSEILQEDEELLELLHSRDACISVDPVELFRKIIINPLKRVVISSEESFIVAIDGIDEADFHRNEGGESIAWLLKQVHSEIPTWLRFILTSASYPSLCDLPVRTIDIDDAEVDQRVNRDGRLLVDYRITICPRLEQKFRDFHDLNPCTDIANELVTRSQGNQLYLQLILDLLEQDKIHLEACNLSLLPNNLSQLYLLLLNIHFSTIIQFNKVADVVSVLIASLRPLDFDDLLGILNAAELSPTLTAEDLNKKLNILSPIVIKLSNGCLVPIHSTFREWMLKMSDQTDYAIDIRMGHILHALALVRRGNLNADSLFELGHHLLKANPYKYLRQEMAADLPRGKDCQVEWIKRGALNNLIIQQALLYERNLYYPNSKVSRLLLLCGANPNAIWPDGDTLLCKYAHIGNLTMVQVLLHYNADPNLPNGSTRMTPLMMAIHRGNLEIVRTLLGSGARLDVVDKNKRGPIIHAAISPAKESTIIMTYLLEYISRRGIPVERDFGAAFEAASAFGKIPICELLLNCKNAMIDLSTAMCAACANGQTETVQFLLSRGATLSVDHCWQGKSALLCAIDSGSWDLVVNILNKSQIDLNRDYTTEEGWTPLIVACRHGHAGLVDLLINRGANMDIPDNKGQTAIMHAVIKGNTSTAILLIEKGCNIHAKDHLGNGLIHLLAQYTNKFLIDKLLSLGLSLEDKNNADLRAVELAIWNRNNFAVDIFLRRGARLRTLTWKVAVESDPELILVLIRKLLDDAAILIKRKHQKEAIQRFEYALEKCNELLMDNFIPDSNRSSVIVNNSERQKVASIKPQLVHYKVQILIAMASVKRKNNEISAAISYATEGLHIAESDDSKFDLYMCRAKCHFDDQNINSARLDAKAAACIRPENSDVSNLLSILSTP